MDNDKSEICLGKRAHFTIIDINKMWENQRKCFVGTCTKYVPDRAMNNSKLTSPTSIVLAMCQIQ